ncbi:aspartate ammonia-lyase [bacterium]|nr:aspartate ammonia-lyase [candidate division CSSED10-310 bacterium]
MRTERDRLGELEIPDDAYYGIHTVRAQRNFPVSGYKLFDKFISAFASVKKACALTNASLGFLSSQKTPFIVTACDELIEGSLHDQIMVDAFQGGAGTSTNMNVNEVIANRAIELSGREKGDYAFIDPLNDVNMHQSTNDVYPTAVKIAALNYLSELEPEIASLQEIFQVKETMFGNVLKTARTQLQDAVPITAGMTFGAYAEAISRDRWRIFKCRERIKVINLGGTAVGTGIGAPRNYIFRVTDELRRITGLKISRAENLIDATQNTDSFAEVSGMLKTYAVNLHKIASDLRLLSSGPDTGLSEVTLPAVQSGSTIMPGKINPVIPEMVSQCAFRVFANDHALSLACSSGQLELNQFMPLIAHSLLESLHLLLNTTKIFRELCVRDLEINRERCEYLVKESRMLVTVLVPVLGYKTVETIVNLSLSTEKSIREIIRENGYLDQETIETILSPKYMQKLGSDWNKNPGLESEKQ